MDAKTVFEEIQGYINRKLYFRASDLFQERVREAEENGYDFLGELYYEYAFFLFDTKEFEKAFGFFLKAFEMDYEKEAIWDILTQAYLVPNLDELRTNYEKNMDDFYKNQSYLKRITFDSLKYTLIPSTDTSYYMLDKAGKYFIEKIDSGSKEDLSFKDEYSDIVITNEKFTCGLMYQKLDRKIYFLIDDDKNLEKVYACFMHPDIKNKGNIIIFPSHGVFQQYFHENTGISLPRNIFANDEETACIEKIIQEEHLYRLTPEGRNKDNIILSVVMPSYNRGHRALEGVRNFLESEYDCEIEIVVSNNGSTKYIEEYHEIQNFSDSRVSYFAFNENQGAPINFAHGINIANGRFACLLSDEDHVRNEVIGHYLYVLKTNPDIAIVHSQLDFASAYKTQIYEKGEIALLTSMLADNYISGLIYNVNIFKSMRLFEFVKLYLKQNNYAVIYYPHSSWSILMTYKGEFYRDNMALTEYKKPADNLDGKNTMPDSFNKKAKVGQSYMDYDNRHEQHRGFVYVLNHFKCLHNVAESTIKKAYEQLCYKTAMLLSINKNRYTDITEDKMRSETLELFKVGANHLELKVSDVFCEKIYNTYFSK